MSGHQPFRAQLHTCQACATDMPHGSVRKFVDDGVELYVCNDSNACLSRLGGRIAAGRATGTTSFIMAAVNRLSRRVEDLEAWQRAGGDRPAAPETPTEAAAVAYDRYQAGAGMALRLLRAKLHEWGNFEGITGVDDVARELGLTLGKSTGGEAA